MKDQSNRTPSAVTRRLFVSAAAGASSILAAQDDADIGQATHGNSHDLADRSKDAYRIRVDAARAQRDLRQVDQTPNSDEADLPNRIGNFSKGLPHNSLGEVNTNAYETFRRAMVNGGDQADIENIPMGSTDRKFVNPCSGIAFQLEGTDSHNLAIPPAPSVRSAEAAGEMVELY